MFINCFGTKKLHPLEFRSDDLNFIYKHFKDYFNVDDIISLKHMVNEVGYVSYTQLNCLYPQVSTKSARFMLKDQKQIFSINLSNHI